MPTCPNGHQSGSDDWCEVCGHRMGAVPPPPPPPPPYAGGGAPPQPPPGRNPAAGYGYPPNATAQAELCPQCRTPREAGAPFCEECRWNFLTNTATSYTPVAPNLPPGFQSQQQPPRPPDSFDYQSSRPSQVNRPAEPLTNAPSGQAVPPPPPPPPPYQQQSAPPPPSFAQPPRAPQPPHPAEQREADDWLLPPPSRAQPQGPGQGQPQGPGHPQGQPQGPGRQAPPQQFQPPQSQPPQPQSPQPQQGPGQPPPDRPSHPGQPGQPTGEAPTTAGWSATVGPDREYFMAMMQRSGPEATGLNLPAYSPEQRLPLDGNQITIGRRRHSTGESPDIDLSVPPEDPGVSHQHAVLVQQPDGSWAVVDQNSTNGTTVNGGEDPIPPYVPIPLQEGDRVHVGAWTTIRIHRGQ
ncbi:MULTISPECIES: FHA domain-containing protein [unclassified Streptomyces]|uniref:FHA domain-containing protein n=1 Tax=unclassified Streptomyces TaxID=2593676 RepID=UPI002E129E56|nr:FHA domain-containing protein [Streptomyces sp. NBC_01197]WSS49253.1 FHA domain-containing protein [Streptomyces sp. NBC_01180]